MPTTLDRAMASRLEWRRIAERYERALNKIAGPDPKSTLDEPDLDWEVVVKLRAIARAALSNGD